MNMGDELLDERRRRRRAGDPRLSDEDREILLAIITEPLAKEFQAAVDADLADPILGGRDDNDD